MAEVVRVEVAGSSSHPDYALQRTVHYKFTDGVSRQFTETVSPIYVPGEAASPKPGSGAGADQLGPTPSEAATGSTAALSDFQKSWSDKEDQARSAAKWIATALGAALGVLVGSAPLTGLSADNIPAQAYYLAGAGLALIGVTGFLVLRVLIPRFTGFGDLMGIQQRPVWRRLFSPRFENLRGEASAHGGVMLPIGITSLDELGWRADIETRTLDEIARLQAQQGTPAQRKLLAAAREQRGGWLEILNTHIIIWTQLASYETVRRQAKWASSLGLTCAILGTAAIIGAFTLPQPKIAPANLTTYTIVTPPALSRETQQELGPGCSTFKGIVTATDYANRTVQILAIPAPPCHGGLITIADANLKTP